MTQQKMIAGARQSAAATPKADPEVANAVSRMRKR